MSHHQTGISFLFALYLILNPFHCLAGISVIDDQGRRLQLMQPAQRIISLAPHTTELLFAAGAGNKVVGAVKFSDYPESAKHIARVGDTHNLDLERIISLKPDLIVTWFSGNSPTITEKLQNLNYTLYISEPDSLQTIAKTITDLGILAGTVEIAKQNSRHYLDILQKLTDDYADRTTVKTFYQFWHQPIFTISGNHVINEVIQLCGGQNVFFNLPTLSPQISLEAVLKANPEVIIASGADALRPEWLDNWQRWPSLSAVQAHHLYFIPPDLILRHTPRILEGAAMLCKHLDKARK